MVFQQYYASNITPENYSAMQQYSLARFKFVRLENSIVEVLEKHPSNEYTDQIKILVKTLGIIHVLKANEIDSERGRRKRMAVFAIKNFVDSEDFKLASETVKELAKEIEDGCN